MPLFRAWRRRALRVLLPVLAVALVAAGTAWATTPASLTLSSNGTQNFSGHVTATNFLPPSPATQNTPCPSQALDPTNTVCEHLTLNATANGTATVCVFFAPGTFGTNDLDLFVVDSSGTLVASSTSASNTQECVTFSATAGVSYEVRINPSFVEDVTGLDFTGTVTFNVTGTGGGAGGGGGGTPGPGPTGRSFTGGGKDAAAQQINMNVFDSDLTKGKVAYLDKAANCKARVTSFVVVQLTATAQGGDAHVVGNDVDTGNQVTVDAHDRGEPGSNDSFTIQVTSQTGGTVICSGGGTLTSGNFQFHPAN
jgi:hypothetical protein